MLVRLRHVVFSSAQAARTQLQLAAKANPTLLDRYFIYVALETAKKLKSEGGLHKPRHRHKQCKHRHAT